MEDITNLDFLEVGNIVKPHGIKGDVLVLPITNRPERFQAGVTLFIAKPDGSYKELTIDSIAQYRSGFLVRFAGYDTMTSADTLRNTKLFAEPLPADEDELFIHQMIGLNVIDQNNVVRGKVSSVEANPASDLLTLENGGLVPLVFVRSVTDKDIFVEIPEGLLD